MVELFKQKGKINLIYTSGQNIDRLTSIYRACKRTGKIFVVDVYVAKVLKELSKYAGIPYPSDTFNNIKVIFSVATNKIDKEILYEFTDFKIKREEIDNQCSNIVMVVRPSMKRNLDKMDKIDGGNFIYSMWEGYLQKAYTKNFIDYLQNRQFTFFSLHTSGHADTQTLKKMVEAIKPKKIVPIHTFDGDKYKDIFNEPIVELKDGEIREI